MSGLPKRVSNCYFQRTKGRITTILSQILFLQNEHVSAHIDKRTHMQPHPNPRSSIPNYMLSSRNVALKSDLVASPKPPIPSHWVLAHALLLA